MISAPALWLPPSIEEHVRGPVSWKEYQRQREWACVRKMLDNTDYSIFPFPFSFPKVSGGNDAYTQVLLHGDTGPAWVDSSYRGRSVTNTGATLDTTNYKFGGGSISISPNQYLTITDNIGDLNPGTGDFTIDFWVRYASISSARTAIAYGTATTYIFLYAFTDGTNLVLHGSNSGSSWNLINGNTWHAAPSLNTWYHLALERYSGTLYTYVNGIGTNQGSGFSGQSPNPTPTLLYIGRANAGNYFSGQIEEFRWSTTSRYKGSNFTPPTQAYY